MGGLTDLLGKVAGQGVGIAGSAVGGIFDLIGNVGRMKEAKKQMAVGRQAATQRASAYNTTYNDLLGMANNQETYKADYGAYERLIQEANKQKAEASGLPPDALYRADARQTTANTIQSAKRGARSATDLMSIAGMAGVNESGAMRKINAQSAELMYDAGQRANSSVLSSLSNYAGARERGNEMEFRSLADKNNLLLDLTSQKGLNMADINYQNSQEQLARSANLQEMRSNMWSGAGDIFRSIGSGMANMNMQNQQYNLLKSAYGGSNGGLNIDFSKYKGINFNPAKTPPTGWVAPGVPGKT